MIDFESYTLPNGLSVILHQDPLRTVATVNVLYRVGSRHDPPGRTGLAHLFEHLMFAGSENVPDFDDALQRAGGENNALTSSDYTLYYNTLPAANLETALFLESDRMRRLRFSQRILDNEKRIVIEEFRETCLEQPYGDLYHHLNGLIYREHPYRWPVIGSDLEHIRRVTLDEVRQFYYRYYRPDNAILCVAGKFDPETVRAQVMAWFGSIPPARDTPENGSSIEEPEQSDYRHLRVEADVPSPVIYLHFRTVSRTHPDFPATDVLSFLLGGGRSSLLHRELVRDRELFTEITASINDNLEAGGILVEARPGEEADYDEAREALMHTIEKAVERGFGAEELAKVKNRLENRNHYKDANIGVRAGELVFYALLGRPELVNHELEQYLDLSVDDLNRVARRYLKRSKCSELEYLSET